MPVLTAYWHFPTPYPDKSSLVNHTGDRNITITLLDQTLQIKAAGCQSDGPGGDRGCQSDGPGGDRGGQNDGLGGDRSVPEDKGPDHPLSIEAEPPEDLEMEERCKQFFREIAIQTR